jgi:hypothetical protein
LRSVTFRAEIHLLVTDPDNPLENRSGHLGGVEVGSIQPASLQVGISQIGIFQIGALQVCAKEFCFT